MPRGKNSDAITAVVSKELKEKLKKYAQSKHWSVSQAAAILIAEGLKLEESKKE
ncbi:putative eal/GGDEF/PAS domain-containing protein [Gloeothece verrucosa]|uniref:Putative eal/GGDEF/PAS domain protein n=1 Tax=Gloeothece verrucosa (strain PCC 7822) TaxID=497965 RepID=E0UM43_GLOV7|nr:putative eal/GGDEF/PAS domain-containing protein [Gloeothece verrucosa]ADN18023.1 putative eal/GGDEF/PAS domain protein [Gloeothece verrucosa PCC 7822]